MKKNDSGFTLVELICVVAILGLITVSIFTFILSGMGMAKETKKSTALSENARTTINKMKTDIMNCGSCVIGTDGSATGNISGTSTSLGDTFFLLTEDGTTADGKNATYSVNCYKYDSGKIYYGKATGVAMAADLTNDKLAEKCQPMHQLCDYVTSYGASVLPISEKVVTSSGTSDTEDQLKAKRVHIILTLDKDSKNFHTQQDAAIRSDVRYFSSVADAVTALNK
jgi:prepilin-type N-terminal cleavage/methylation domain-containing protein